MEAGLIVLFTLECGGCSDEGRTSRDGVKGLTAAAVGILMVAVRGRMRPTSGHEHSHVVGVQHPGNLARLRRCCCPFWCESV